MRFDQDAYWGLGIGAAIMGRVPVIGPNLVHLMLGGPIIAGETLSRFFTLHVFVIPGLLIALISLHLRLVLAKGINEYPVPGQEVKKETYAEEYEAVLKKEGVPFYPKAIDKDLVFSSLVMLGILFCAAYFGPKGPKGIPNPTYIDTVPAPDFFFLWIYAALALLPPYMETFLLLTAPVVGIALLFALPFLSNTGEKSARRRPMAVLGVILVFLPIGTLSYLGTFAPWGPHMEAWTSVPTPVQYVRERSPLELQGALLVQYKQCRNCHSLGGEGGLRGPALDGVATRLTRDQLIRQVIQGGGNMPFSGGVLQTSDAAIAAPGGRACAASAGRCGHASAGDQLIRKCSRPCVRLARIWRRRRSPPSSLSCRPCAPRMYPRPATRLLPGNLGGGIMEYWSETGVMECGVMDLKPITPILHYSNHSSL